MVSAVAVIHELAIRSSLAIGLEGQWQCVGDARFRVGHLDTVRVALPIGRYAGRGRHQGVALPRQQQYGAADCRQAVTQVGVAQDLQVGTQGRRGRLAARSTALSVYLRYAMLAEKQRSGGDGS